MTAQRPFRVIKTIIFLTGESDPFSDGHTTGYLEFYDDRHSPAEPISSQTISEHLQATWNELSVPPLQSAGCLAEWEPMTVLQRA